MPKHTPLSTIKRISILRAAGYSLSAISLETGVNVRTVSRLCQRFDLRKSDFRKEMLNEAKQQLLSDAESVTHLKAELSALVLDSIAQSRQLRDKLAEARDYLTPSDIESACLVSRAIASQATALGLLEKLGLGGRLASLDNEDIGDLPIVEMTSAEVEAQRAAIEAGDLDDD